MKQIHHCIHWGLLLFWYFQPQGKRVKHQAQIWSLNERKKGRNLNRQETRAGISQEEQEAELRTEKDMEVTGKERQHPLITMYRIFNGLVPAPKQISLTIKHAPLCCRHYSSWFSYFSQVFSLCRNHREQEGNQDVVIEAYIAQKKMHLYKSRELSTCTAWTTNEWI